MEIKKVNLKEKLALVKEYWSPKILGELNNQLVKIAKFKGEFVSHKHEREDELFYVIQGELHIELENKTLHLSTGEFVIIPKGVVHKPYALEEVHIMLFEPSATVNTGNIKNDRTLTSLDKI